MNTLLIKLPEIKLQAARVVPPIVFDDPVTLRPTPACVNGSIWALRPRGSAQVVAPDDVAVSFHEDLGVEAVDDQPLNRAIARGDVESERGDSIAGKRDTRPSRQLDPEDGVDAARQVVRAGPGWVKPSMTTGLVILGKRRGRQDRPGPRPRDVEGDGVRRAERPADLGLGLAALAAETARVPFEIWIASRSDRRRIVKGATVRGGVDRDRRQEPPGLQGLDDESPSDGLPGPPPRDRSPSPHAPCGMTHPHPCMKLGHRRSRRRAISPDSTSRLEPPSTSIVGGGCAHRPAKTDWATMDERSPRRPV